MPVSTHAARSRPQPAAAPRGEANGPVAQLLNQAPRVRQLRAQGQALNNGVVQAVNRSNGTAIGTVSMGNEFRNRHVAASDAGAEGCADYRLDSDRQVIATNTTASTGDWRAAVNANTDNLAEGSHEIAVTVNCRETTMGRGLLGQRTYAHSALAATAKTLGVNVQNHSVHGWRVFVNHVH